MKTIKTTTVTTSSPIAIDSRFGTVMKFSATISAPIITADSRPPKLSTGSVVSFTWAGTFRIAMGSAIATRGSVTRKTDPHQKYWSSQPEMSGPSIANPPPSADHIAMDFVLAGPDHRAVIIESVVG